MQAMVFAAGMGTRLRPLTDTMPKALVEVAGKPLLYHVLMKLKAAGIRRVVINVHHFPDQIISYVRNHDSFGMDIRFSDERDRLLETGGGVLHARPLLEGGDFLVHNVDILSNLDIAGFLAQRRPDALSTVFVSERETARYILFDKDMRMVGWTNVKTGELRTPYPDLDLSACRKLAFAGMHFMSRHIFDAFDETGCTGAFPIMDFYIRHCREYPIYGFVQEGFRIMDVGKTACLPEAEEFLRSIST